MSEPTPQRCTLPASFGQQRLWFLDQLTPGTAVYNMPMSHELRGALDIELLHRSINRIVERHESLRTTLQQQDGRVVQVIARSQLIALPLKDLGGLPAEEQQARARALIQRDSQQPFDLARGPLLRTTLIRLSPEHHVLQLNMHHAISDGWSMGVFQQELQELYTAGLMGRRARLPELTVQYADYSQWQSTQLRGPRVEVLLDYWLGELGDAPRLLELPTDRVRPQVRRHRGANLTFSIPESDLQGLRRLVREAGATLFMGLLAVYAELLARWADQRDLVIGVPVANRTRAELENLIGFFVNTLALRVRPHESLDALGLLRQIRRTTLDAHAHQDLPFELLVEHLRPERHTSYSPVFQVMFALQNDPRSARPNAVSGYEERTHPDGTAKFDLSLYAVEIDDGLLASFEYDVDLFDDRTISSLVGDFRKLLRLLPEHPDRPLRSLSTIDRVDIERWPRTLPPPSLRLPSTGSVVERFFERAAEHPHAPAIRWAGGELSRAELAAMVGRATTRLVAQGVGPEVVVGVAVARSPALIALFLAIWSAGGCYLPLDRHSPPDRSAALLAEAGAALLVTDRATSPTPAFPTSLDLDELMGPGEQRAPVAGLPSSRAAYVLFTSGSTGTPKGVCVTHRSVNALMEWTTTAFEARELSAVLASTSISFDISVFELFAPLWNGGTVMLVDGVLDLLDDLPDVTLLNTVPSACAELVRHDRLPASLTTVCVAGEALPGPLVEALHRRGGLRVLNLYGPTEDTVYSTWAEVHPDPHRPPPIGMPLPNTRAYVLDRNLDPILDGRVGELYLAGDGLARGYIARPAMTADRFVPDPFSEVPGARMYRTGDRVRRRADGMLEFVGRADQQIKLRGFRVEPAEIEHVLSARPGVSRALVLVDGTGAKARLLAWVEAHEDVRGEDLRRELSARLPDYMVPQAIVVLERFPTTPNGKIDRRALERPAHGEPEQRNDDEPRDELEAAIARMWKDVLDLDHVGIHDNFFARGGQSLLATSLLSRLRESFEPAMPLRAVFEHPTVAGMAEVMRRAGARPRVQAAAPADSAPSAGRDAEEIPAIPRSAAEARALLTRIDELSPETIASLLAQLTTKNGARR